MYKPTTKADERWLREGGYYDHSRPEQVREFAKKFCSIADRPDQEFEFLPWQWKNVICPLYGCRNADDTNRFTRGSIWCPRKVCKSITLSVVLLWEMLRVRAPQVYVVSSSVESASQIFNFAAYSIETGGLKDIFHVNSSQRIITFHKHLKIPGLCKVFSGGKKGRSGQGATCVLFDELAEINDDTAWHRLYNSSRARRNDNPVWLSISSPQYERYELPFSQFELSKSIIEGENDDPSYLAQIVEVPESIPLDKVEDCAKYLPNIPAVMSVATLREEYEQAKRIPRDLARYRNHSLGQWAWGSLNYWLPWPSIDKCFIKFEDDDPALKGQPCLIAVDGSVSNLSCYIIYFLETKHVIARFFLPRTTAVESDNAGDGNQYQANSGETTNSVKYITLTDFMSGTLFDWKTMKASIEADMAKFNVREVAFDPYRLETTMTDYMNELKGKAKVTVVPPGKSYVARPTKEFERLICHEELKIQFNPIAKQNCRNAAVKQDAHENIILDRVEARGRYDFVAAMVIGLNRVISRQNKTLQLLVPTN